MYLSNICSHFDGYDNFVILANNIIVGLILILGENSLPTSALGSYPETPLPHQVRHLHVFVMTLQDNHHLCSFVGSRIYIFYLHAFVHGSTICVMLYLPEFHTEKCFSMMDLPNWTRSNDCILLL